MVKKVTLTTHEWQESKKAPGPHRNKKKYRRKKKHKKKSEE